MDDKRFKVIWYGIVYRCNNPKCSSYIRYGARGIKCLWETYEDFKVDMYDSYIKHVNEYGEKNTSIDRIDVNGNYCRENCRWATRLEQANNTRKNTIIDGKSLADWCRDNGLNYNTIRNRLHYWDLTKALTTPIKGIVKNNYDFDGLNLKEYCDKLNKDYNLVLSRIAKGWDIDVAINTPKREKLMYNGMALIKYCELNSINVDTIYNRLRNGMTLEEAVNTPINKPKKYTINGKSLKQYCKENGLNYGTIKSRIYRGYSVEDAVSLPIGGK